MAIAEFETMTSARPGVAIWVWSYDKCEWVCNWYPHLWISFRSEHGRVFAKYAQPPHSHSALLRQVVIEWVCTQYKKRMRYPAGCVHPGMELWQVWTGMLLIPPPLKFLFDRNTEESLPSIYTKHSPHSPLFRQVVIEFVLGTKRRVRYQAGRVWSYGKWGRVCNWQPQPPSGKKVSKCGGSSCLVCGNVGPLYVWMHGNNNRHQ